MLSGRKILIIEDDADLLKLYCQLLEKVGAVVHAEENGSAGLRRFYELRPDLVILDIMLPDMDGWQICAIIRQLSDVPILILSALDEEDHIVRGFDCGAVDYVTKLSTPKVLLARVNAAIRQADLIRKETIQVTYADDYLTIELTRHRVTRQGVSVKLTSTEFGLLAFLVKHPDQLLTNQQILENVWGKEYGDSIEYVHVYISNLRRKLERDPRHPMYIITERGIGYKFATQRSSK